MMDLSRLAARQRRKREFWLMVLYALARLPLPICKGDPEGGAR